MKFDLVQTLNAFFADSCFREGISCLLIFFHQLVLRESIMGTAASFIPYFVIIMRHNQVTPWNQQLFSHFFFFLL